MFRPTYTAMAWLPDSGCRKVDSQYTTRHDTTRHRIFFTGPDMFEFALVRNRQLTTKTVEYGMKKK